MKISISWSSAPIVLDCVGLDHLPQSARSPLGAGVGLSLCHSRRLWGPVWRWLACGGMYLDDVIDLLLVGFLAAAAAVIHLE